MSRVKTEAFEWPWWCEPLRPDALHEEKLHHDVARRTDLAEKMVRWQEREDKFKALGLKEVETPTRSSSYLRDVVKRTLKYRRKKNREEFGYNVDKD